MSTINALAPWYGSNRMLAENVGMLLDGCEWVGVGMAGGMCELKHIKARTLVVNDKHKHIINLATVAAHPVNGPKLYRRLRRLPFCPDTLAQAQQACLTAEHNNFPMGSLDWAVAFYVACWMGRNGKAGTDSEFKGQLSFRWEAGGGDSAKRFSNGVFSLREWRQFLARGTFTCLDVFDFLDKCQDKPKHGIYLDPPWIDDGDSYKHKFGVKEQHQLACRFSGFLEARVVVRHGDHPLVRQLYPEREWTWHRQTSRTAANKDKAEVLLVKN